MDVILLERIEKLGQMGEIVQVKAGFARNYLLPQKKALRATKDNMARFEQQRTELEARNLTLRKEAESVAARMDAVSVVLVRQASDMGQLYGSVSARDIAEALSEAGYRADRRQVVLDRPIKTLGIHKVRVALHPEVAVTVDVNVARSAAEAEQQAAGTEVFFERAELVPEEESETAEEAETEAPEGEGRTPE